MNNSNHPFESEDAWTARLQRILSVNKDVRVGIGDDAAVVHSVAGVDRVYTTDAVIESTHFLPGTAPHRIGHKIVGRLLSDLAAMGATPEHILLNLVVPPGISANIMEQIYEGAEQLARRFGADIIGGDTVAATPLSLHGFAAGSVPSGTAVLRSGGRAGDQLFVTGDLGGSRAGKHLDFIPRIEPGVWLREGMWAVAMMDLSDGLARDLKRMCEASGVGADIHADRLPISKHVRQHAESDTTLMQALCDGEDYELLLAVRPDRAGPLETMWPDDFPVLTRIGAMNDQPGQLHIVHSGNRRLPMPSTGFDHLGQ